MNPGGRRRRLGIAGIGIAAFAVAAALLLGRGSPHASVDSRDQGVVVIGSGAPPARDAAAEPTPPAARVAAALAPALPADPSMLRALGLPVDARLDRLTATGSGTVCGTAWTAGSARRFVYVGMAKMGAVDDGSADFARMHNRLCGRG